MLDQVSVPAELYTLVRAAAPRISEVGGDPAAVDLREAGLSSVAAVRLMLEVEAAFDIAIPDEDLTPENFASIGAIARLIRRLKTSANA